MIKRTLFFGNPAYLSTHQEQLVVKFPDGTPKRQIPIEEVGIVVLEHQQITITNGLLAKLSERKVAVVSCNAQHLPNGLFFPLTGHTEQTERIRHQMEATIPLKKNLWQQTVASKIRNQAALLAEQGKESKRMEYLSKNVSSGDPDNYEGQAAAIYWKKIFDLPDFTRGQAGIPPNNLLNYGYAILRATVARALVSSGMLPNVGIWHHNKYNAFCLADDIMEPYRPYVDLVVSRLVEQQDELDELTILFKKELLTIPALDVMIDGQKSPLMVAVSRTSSSLYECFAGTRRKILYPDYG